MDIGLETLSQIVTFNKYAKYLPQLNRRETYDEIVMRYVQMMVDKYPHMANKIVNQAQYIFDKKILPSMRAMQFAGPAIQKNEAKNKTNKREDKIKCEWDSFILCQVLAIIKKYHLASNIGNF